MRVCDVRRVLANASAQGGTRIVKGVKLHKLFVDGDDACLLYDMETSTPVGTAFISECYRVRDGKVASIRAVFDARGFAPVFSK